MPRVNSKNRYLPVLAETTRERRESRALTQFRGSSVRELAYYEIAAGVRVEKQLIDSSANYEVVDFATGTALALHRKYEPEAAKSVVRAQIVTDGLGLLVELNENQIRRMFR